MENMIDSTLEFLKSGESSERVDGSTCPSIAETCVDEAKDAAGTSHRRQGKLVGRRPAFGAEEGRQQPHRQRPKIRDGSFVSKRAAMTASSNSECSTTDRESRRTGWTRLRSLRTIETSRSKETGGVGLGHDDSAIHRKGASG